MQRSLKLSLYTELFANEGMILLYCWIFKPCYTETLKISRETGLYTKFCSGLRTIYDRSLLTFISVVFINSLCTCLPGRKCNKL